MIRKVEHTAIIVNDMDRSIDFYCNYFGFILRTRGKTPAKELAFLYHPNQSGFEIELINNLTPDYSYASKGIVNHLALTVDDIYEAIRFYREKGIHFNTEEPSPSIDGGKTIFFYGPSQELLQLVQPSKERKGEQ
ncbi:VOC family protein [Paenibacillus sp. UNC451MF]|uniref:VOC family protein n=1 Tax=Paenibacillus sp. UNC451MF TaxID=1449063 RepID=UPI00049155E4|nr:VOC family protein [Paenibacillus sp. UNC451MF]